VLVVDNLSPFTPNILKSFEGLGITPLHLEFSKVSGEALANCERVILSGRRRNSKEINSANSRIVKYCAENGKPILGICYGAEIIALTLGGTIRRMHEHVQGQTTVKINKRNQLTGDQSEISVYESHAYCVARLPSGFTSLASSTYCHHEIFSHEKKPIFGTQFHPEKSGIDGDLVLKSFLKI
jgi:GMP synthase (glutamine-hydrolysing)